MKKVLFLTIINVLFCCISYSQTIGEVRKNVMGNWVSVQDSNYSMLVKSKTLLEIYKGTDGNDSFKYCISNKNCGIEFKLCKNNCFYLTKIDTDGTKLCYLIKDISKDYLTLVYEGGAVLDFVKQKRKPIK